MFDDDKYYITKKKEMIYMNKHERKEIKKMQLMIESFNEIVEICNEKSILLYVDPAKEAQRRYIEILDIIEATSDSLIKIV